MSKPLWMNDLEGFNKTYTKEAIIERFNSGEKLDILTFWGHTNKKDTITKTCLSQWYGSLFRDDKLIYFSAEQFMMAQKALLFNDRETYHKIMSSCSSEECKSLGREIKGFDEDVWGKRKFGIVLRGNYAKFIQNPKLCHFLLSTGDKILVEASPYDTGWGVGLKASDPDINDPNKWRGENLLGFALMGVRCMLETFCEAKKLSAYKEYLEN